MIVGDVVRCYKDWNNPCEFDGFVELLEYQPSKDEVQMSLKNGEKVTGKPPFMYDEVSRPMIEFPDDGSLWWYQSKLCSVISSDKRGDKLRVKFVDDISMEDIVLEYPFPIEQYYEEGFYDVTYDGEYIGYVSLVVDKHKTLYIIDNLGERRKLKRHLTEINSNKYEPRAVLWTAQRWLVRRLVPSFPSQLCGDVWFSDVGLCDGLVYKNGVCTFEINGKQYGEKYSPDMFMVKDTMDGAVTHRYIPFYLTTDSEFSSYSNEWDSNKHNNDEEE
jgi:hypothetical protein